MNRIFVLQHLHVLPDGCEDVKFLGVYSSIESAHAAIERLKLQPGFCDHPNIVDQDIDTDDQGFHLDDYEVDRDHWTQGYVTV